jgi:hypothetical protein
MLRSAVRLMANDFVIGLWHVFGAHGHESRDQILERKQREIDDTGFTLWSFQHRRMETFEHWYREITALAPARVYVFCSDSPNAKSPPGRTHDATTYQEFKSPTSRPVPSGVRVPHPFGSGREASAFIVASVGSGPFSCVWPRVEWLCLSDGSWRSQRVPTRGETLLRPGGDDAMAMRPIYRVLELREPYFAIVRS